MPQYLKMQSKRILYTARKKTNISSKDVCFGQYNNMRSVQQTLALLKKIYLRFGKSWSNYAVLRAGLGLISLEELAKLNKEHSYGTDLTVWCPVKYLVLKHRMSGEYVVVEGPVNNQKPAEPEIRFRVNCCFVLYIRGLRGNGSELPYYLEGYRPGVSSLDRDSFTFPELVAGWRGFSMEDLKERLFTGIKHDMDPQTMENLATEKFYVNELEAINNG